MNNINMPKVSVVVPIYNIGEQLNISVNSILEQTYENMEILLVDDGSTDGSYDICRRLAECDTRIRCFRQENLGSGPARNTGIKNASGKYIYFPDADDKMDTSLIESSVRALEENGCDLAVFGFRRVVPGRGTEEIRKLGGVFTGDEVRCEYDKFYGFNDPRGIQGAPWNKMYRLDIIRKNGIEYPPMRRHQDEVFIMRYVNVCTGVVFLDEVLYTYHANDMDGLFKKFPKDYFSIVSECNAYRCEYILGWNRENKKALDLVCRSFADGMCQALIILFNPGFGYTMRERYGAVKAISRRFMSELPDPNYRSDSTLYKLIKRGNYPLLYVAARLALKKHYAR